MMLISPLKSARRKFAAQIGFAQTRLSLAGV